MGKDMVKNTKEIFISYAWGGNSEEFVNKLDRAFQNKGITITRDKRDLGYKGLIKEFMEAIGRGKCVIAVINDKYLKSPNCMFELVQVSKNGAFHDRIFPIVLADARIYDPVQRLEYIKYWEDKKKELNESMQKVGAEFLQGIREEIDQYTEIRNTIAQLTHVLKDMNTLTPDIHSQSDFEDLFEVIKNRLIEEEAPDLISDLRGRGEDQESQPKSSTIKLFSPSNLENDLLSERAVDYRKLKELLIAEKWEEADKETIRKLAECCSGKKDFLGLSTSIHVNSLRNIPCADLQTIDRLWLKYSNALFGFSIQRKVYLQCHQNMPESNNLNRSWDDEYKFQNRVGWKDRTQWKTPFQFINQVPPGNLPLLAGLNIRAQAPRNPQNEYSDDYRRIHGYIEIFLRLEDCKPWYLDLV